MRVYKADALGSQQFIGEDWIDHTPKDERVKIKLGNAFDVVAERTQKDWRKIGRQPLRGGVGDLAAQPQEERHSHRDGHRAGARRLAGLQSTLPGEKVEAHTLQYKVPVPKEGAAKLTYRVRTRF